MFRISNCARTVLLFAIISLNGAGPTVAQTPLTAEERARALEVEQRPSTRTLNATQRPSVRGLENTPGGRAAKSEVSTIKPLEAPPSEDNTRALGVPPRRAEITRFDYATGAVTRTIVDLSATDPTRQVLSRESQINVTTPLNDNELAEARSLLIAKSPEVAEIARTAGSNLKITHLVAMVQSEKLPRFGHRLVSMRVTSPKTSALYLVDLTAQEVERKGL